MFVVYEKRCTFATSERKRVLLYSAKKIPHGGREGGGCFTKIFQLWKR